MEIEIKLLYDCGPDVGYSVIYAQNRLELLLRLTEKVVERKGLNPLQK